MNSDTDFGGLFILLLVIGIVFYTQFIRPIKYKLHKRSEDKRLVELYKQRKQIVEILAKVLKKDTSEIERWSSEKLLSTYYRYIDIMKMYDDNPEKFTRIGKELLNGSKFNEAAVDQDKEITEFEKEQKARQQREQVSKQMIIEKLAGVLSKDVAEIEQWEDEKIINTFDNYLEILYMQKHHPDKFEEAPYSRVQDEECPF